MLELEHLHVTLPAREGTVTVLRDVSLQVPAARRRARPSPCPPAQGVSRADVELSVGAPRGSACRAALAGRLSIARRSLPARSPRRQPAPSRRGPPLPQRDAWIQRLSAEWPGSPDDPRDHQAPSLLGWLHAQPQKARCDRRVAEHHAVCARSAAVARHTIRRAGSHAGGRVRQPSAQRAAAHYARRGSGWAMRGPGLGRPAGLHGHCDDRQHGKENSTSITAERPVYQPPKPRRRRVPARAAPRPW